jgi:hypothetical protein
MALCLFRRWCQHLCDSIQSSDNGDGCWWRGRRSIEGGRALHQKLTQGAGPAEHLPVRDCGRHDHITNRGAVEFGAILYECGPSSAADRLIRRTGTS